MPLGDQRARADLTVLLDLDPASGVGAIEAKDRLEAAGDDFHGRVRQGFLDLAVRDPDRYLVLPRTGRSPSWPRPSASGWPRCCRTPLAG